MQSEQNSQIARPKHVIGLMCANCVRVMRGRWPVCIHIAYKYTRSSYRTRSLWHCAIVPYTRTEPGLTSLPRFVQYTCVPTQSRNADQPRAPLEGGDLQDSSSVPFLTRARLSRNYIAFVPVFEFPYFFKAFLKMKYVYIQFERNHMYVLMYIFSRNMIPWLISTVWLALQARFGGTRVTSSMRCEKQIGHEPRSVSDVGKRNTYFAEINGCRVAAYEYVLIGFAVFRPSVNRICSCIAISTDESTKQIYRILVAREN